MLKYPIEELATEVTDYAAIESIYQGEIAELIQHISFSNILFYNRE